MSYITFCNFIRYIRHVYTYIVNVGPIEVIHDKNYVKYTYET